MAAVHGRPQETTPATTPSTTTTRTTSDGKSGHESDPDRCGSGKDKRDEICATIQKREAAKSSNAKPSTTTASTTTTKTTTSKSEKQKESGKSGRKRR